MKIASLSTHLHASGKLERVHKSFLNLFLQLVRRVWSLQTLFTPSTCSRTCAAHANTFSLAATLKISALKKKRCCKSIWDLRASRHLDSTGRAAWSHFSSSIQVCSLNRFHSSPLLSLACCFIFSEPPVSWRSATSGPMPRIKRCGFIAHLAPSPSNE